MKTMSSFKTLVMAAVFVGFALLPTLAMASTLDNLMAAYNGESNAHAKYLEYAKKADAEGYLGVGSLFRAAAAAEKIHATNHAAVITKMGGTPKADIKLPEIKTTKDNLADAIKGESYERDTMYPGFIAEAKKDGNADALRTLNFAQAAEAEHAKLYQAALDNLDGWKTASNFYVCPVCGYTTQSIDGMIACPVCATPTKMFENVK